MCLLREFRGVQSVPIPKGCLLTYRPHYGFSPPKRLLLIILQILTSPAPGPLWIWPTKTSCMLQVLTSLCFYTRPLPSLSIRIKETCLYISAGSYRLWDNQHRSKTRVRPPVVAHTIHLVASCPSLPSLFPIFYFTALFTACSLPEK
jgi:hypothetical protein